MAEKTLITLTSPDGATLNTAGKYCENDIEVIPNLQEKTVTTGEIVTADEGYSGLKSVDTTPVFEAGKKSEYDAFWDAMQENGERTRYNSFGAGVAIPSEIWKTPKYPFVLERAERFLDSFNTTLDMPPYNRPLDISHWKIDASLLTTAQRFCMNASISNLTVDLSNATSLREAFYSSDRGCCNNIAIKVSEKCETFYLAFWYNTRSAFCYDVVRFIEGSVIAAGDLNLSHCTQSKESLASVINALSDTTTGLTVTLRLAAVNSAFETSAGAADGSTSDEWLALAATKSNWTINLINS